MTWNPFRKKFWIDIETQPLQNKIGCVAPCTVTYFANDKFYFMSHAGLQEMETPKPSRWKRAMETLENIVWWIGGLIFIVAVAVALMLLSTMALIGKWVISIDLFRQLLSSVGS